MLLTVAAYGPFNRTDKTGSSDRITISITLKPASVACAGVQLVMLLPVRIKSFISGDHHPHVPGIWCCNNSFLKIVVRNLEQLIYLQYSSGPWNLVYIWAFAYAQIFRAAIVHLDDLKQSWEGYIIYFLWRGEKFEITARAPFSKNRYTVTFGLYPPGLYPLPVYIPPFWHISFLPNTVEY